MTRFTTALAALCTVFFAAALTLLHTQPYHDGGLRASLATTERCPAPCFMDIRPGVTLATDAYDALDRHPWVSTIDLYVTFNTLAWSWSGAQPDWIDSGEPGMLWLDHNVVQYIKIKTRVAFGDMLLLTHNSDGGLLPLKRSRLDSSRLFSYLIGFRAQGSALQQPDVIVESYLPCSLTLMERWQVRVWLKIMVDAAAAEIDPIVPVMRPHQGECHRS